MERERDGMREEAAGEGREKYRSEREKEREGERTIEGDREKMDSEGRREIQRDREIERMKETCFTIVPQIYISTQQQTIPNRLRRRSPRYRWMRCVQGRRPSH